MIRAAIMGLGRWGQNLVDCTQGKTGKIRFTTGVAPTPEKARALASAHGLALLGDYAAALADPAIDAVVLATPHTQHAEHVIAAVRAGKHVFDYPQGSTERAELEAFAEAIEGGTPYACPPDDAVHGVAVLDAIVKSARSGQREPIG